MSEAETQETLNREQVLRLTPRVRVVLVQTLYPGNVGAAARAMLNFGFERMVLVEPQHWQRKKASRMAAGADQVFDRALRAATVEEAVQGCDHVYGTTARVRQWSWPVLEPGPAAEHASGLIHDGAEIAVVFGREDFGLSNKDLLHCNQLIRIPTAGLHDSLNLSQAVLLLCWELHKALRGEAPPTPRRTAKAEVLDGTLRNMDALLRRIRFYDGKNRDQTLVTLRTFLSQAGLRAAEVQFLAGIARKISWHLDNPGRSLPPDDDDPFADKWEQRQAAKKVKEHRARLAARQGAPGQLSEEE